MPERYAAEWSVDLSGMKRNSLPSEGLFNHVCRLRRLESMTEWEWRGKAEEREKLHREHRGKGTEASEKSVSERGD